MLCLRNLTSTPIQFHFTFNHDTISPSQLAPEIGLRRRQEADPCLTESTLLDQNPEGYPTVYFAMHCFSENSALLVVHVDSLVKQVAREIVPAARGP